MASNRELRILGRTLAEIQGRSTNKPRPPATSARLAAIYQLRARRERVRRRWSRFGYGAGAAALAAALMLFVLRPRALEFRINEGAGSGVLGVLIAAPHAGGRNLSFSDGSRLRLHEGAQARVVSSNEHGARVVLERGLMRADVVPRPNNDWSLFGGPFEIHVTGTSFDTSWDPQRQQLFVNMLDGHVLVSAECLLAPRALSAGQSATFSCVPEPVTGSTQGPVSASTQGPLATAAAPASATGALAVSAPALQSQPSAGGVSSAELAVHPPGWHELSALGDYAGSLAAAESQGFERLCETLSSAELLELASIARLAGRSERANAGYAAAVALLVPRMLPAPHSTWGVPELEIAFAGQRVASWARALVLLSAGLAVAWGNR